MTSRSVIVVWFLALATAACGDPEPLSTVTSGEGRQQMQGDAAWPESDLDGASSFVVEYPEDLPERAVAFDGTITGVSTGSYDEDAGATPVRLDVQINEVFAGDVGDSVVVRTWDFILQGRDVEGARILAAAERSLDVMGCGFTRPYSSAEAAEWRATFSSGESE